MSATYTLTFADPAQADRVTIGEVTSNTDAPAVDLTITVPILDEGVTHRIDTIRDLGGSTTLELNPHQSSVINTLVLAGTNHMTNLSGEVNYLHITDSHLTNSLLPGATRRLVFTNSRLNYTTFVFDNVYQRALHAWDCRLTGTPDHLLGLQYLGSGVFSSFTVDLSDARDCLDYLTPDHLYHTACGGEPFLLKPQVPNFCLPNLVDDTIRITPLTYQGEAYVLMGCYLDTMEEARQFIKADATYWPTFSELVDGGVDESDLDPTYDQELLATITATRRRYQATLDFIEAVCS